MTIGKRLGNNDVGTPTKAGGNDWDEMYDFHNGVVMAGKSANFAAEVKITKNVNNTGFVPDYFADNYGTIKCMGGWNIEKTGPLAILDETSRHVTAQASSEFLDIVDSAGRGVYLYTALTPAVNPIAGWIGLSSKMARRSQNFRIRFLVPTRVNTGNVRRTWFGFKDLPTLFQNTDSPLLDTDQGFVLGHGAADVNFKVYRSNGTAKVEVDTGFALPAVVTNQIYEIIGTSTGMTARILDFTGTVVNYTSGELTTNIPASATDMYFHYYCQMATTSQQVVGLRKGEFKGLY
jgi:hypothetical protein